MPLLQATPAPSPEELAELDLDEGFVPDDLLQVGGWMGGWVVILCMWMVGLFRGPAGGGWWSVELTVAGKVCI